MYEISNNTGRYCIECKKELGYLDPNKKTFYKGTVEIQSCFSDREHPKFKKKRQRCFDCAISKYGAITYRPNIHHSDFGGYLFNEEIDKSNVGVTLENMISRHGEIEGKKKFDTYRSKQAYTNTFEYKSKKYGWDEKDFKEFNKSRATTLENMISRHGEIEGKKKFYTYRSKQAYTNTLDYFIDKLGIEEGTDEYNRICSEKSITLENMTRVYGPEIGLIKYEDFRKKRKFGIYYSDISQELFVELDKHIIVGSYFATKNHEFGLHSGIEYYCYDYVIPDLKKVVEFNGDYWHANPLLYESNWIHPHLNKSALEIWNNDARKNKIVKERKYDLMVVWESDYRKDKEEIIKQCLEFINEN